MKAILVFVSVIYSAAIISAQSPGGVSQGLHIWLKADAGISSPGNGMPVSSWIDQSPNGNSATQNNAANRPTFVSNAINGYPAVRTDFNKFLNVNLSGITNQSYTIFAVTQRQSGWIGQFIIGQIGTSPHAALNVGYQTQTRLRYQQYGNEVRVSAPTYDPNTEVPTIIFAEFNEAAGKSISCVRDGALSSAANNSTTKYSFTGQGVIGQAISASNYFTGYISEIIVYNRVLTAAEKREVQTYLSVKYGLTIRTVDHLYYNESGFAGDMVGIGRNLSASGLNHSTSASINKDDVLRISNPTSLEDGDYLVCGNQNGSILMTPFVGNNCMITNIMQRRWKARRTGDVGNVDLRFDMSGVSNWNGSDLGLLIDSNGNGFDDEAPVQGIYNAPYFEVSGVNLPNGSTFTIATGKISWYAVTSGSTSAAIWSTTPNGTPQLLTSLCDKSNLIINSGVSVTNDWPSFTCNSFVVNPGGIFNAGSGTVELKSDLIINGIVNAQTSTFNFTGTTLQNIKGSGVANAFNLTCNNASGVAIDPLSGGVRARNLVQVNAGNLSTGGKLTLISDASSTGIIGPLTGGTITGDVEVQRYHQAAVQGWVNICSPVQNKTINDWNDDLITTGFLGSDFPPPYSFNNVQYYNEPVSGGINNGFVGVNNVNNAILDKRGYFVFMNAGTMNLDVTGTINTGNQTLPVTYTNTGTPAADGWNLIANPYPCTIDWNATGWTKTNINNAFYVWNAAVGQYSSYINGFGTNGGSRYIPSTQSFFVIANAPSPVLQITENCKATVQGTFKSNDHSGEIFTMQICREGMTDEIALVRNDFGTPGFDSDLDAYKLRSPLAEVPYLSVIGSDGIDLSINSVGELDEEFIIPLRIEAGVSGVYTLTHQGLSDFAKGACIVLEDLLTGAVYPLNQYSEIELMLDSGNQNIRFQLRVGAAVVADITTSGCPGMAQGSAQVNLPDNPGANVTWYNSEFDAIAVSANNGQVHEVQGLTPGTYTVVIENNGVCGATSFEFMIDGDNPIVAVPFIAGVSCPDKADGSIELQLSGGKGEYNVVWSHGATGKSITGLEAGEYVAFVTDESGCADSFDIEVPFTGKLTSAFETQQQNYELKNGAVIVEFYNTSDEATSHNWNFGDGTQTSNEQNPSHLFNKKGLYEITLQTTDGNCNAISKKSIRIVEPKIQDAAMASDIIGTLTDQGVQLMFFFDQPRQLKITAYNVLGQQLTEPITGVFERQTMYFSDRRYAANSLVEVLDLKTGERAILRMGR